MTDTSPIDYEVKQMSEFCAVRGRVVDIILLENAFSYPRISQWKRPLVPRVQAKTCLKNFAAWWQDQALVSHGSKHKAGDKIALSRISKTRNEAS
jgi:hypothetical protein